MRRLLAMFLFSLLLSCFFSFSAFAAVQFAQQAVGNNANTQNTSLSVPFLNATTAGNLIVVYVTPAPNQVGSISVTDSAGNTYSPATSTFTTGIPGCGMSQEFFYAANISGGNDTVTATRSEAGGMGMVILEYSGIAATSPLDAQAGTSQTSSCPWSAGPTSASFTTLNADDLIVSGASLSASSSWTAGTGYALRTASSNEFAIEDQIVSSSGTYTGSFSISPNQSWIAAAVAFKAAGPSCGVLDDGSTIYTPQNYTTFVPPTKMGTYNDPVFGCTVLRLTDGRTDFSTNTGHNYIRSAFNAGDSKFLAMQNGSGNFSAVDLATGSILVAPGQFEFSGSAADETWDRNNPNIIYYELYNSNVLKKADISACTLSSPCDGAHGTNVATSVIHTFAEYTSLDTNNNKRDISDDGCYLAMGGYYTTLGLGYIDVFKYNICTDTKSRVAQTCLASVSDHFASGMTHSNQTWVGWANGGTGNCQGVWLYSSNMDVVGQLFTGTPHSTAAYDPVANKEYILFEASGSGTNACNSGSTSGIGKVEVDTAPPFPMSCFVSFPYNLGDVHVSSNNTTGWFAAEMGDTTGSATCSTGSSSTSCTANDNSTLPSNWNSTGVWGHLYNEIIVGNISTGQIYRLAHSRSRLTGASSCGGYWTEPRVSMDFSGTRIAFDSSMARTDPPLPSCIQDYADTYMINFR